MTLKYDERIFRSCDHTYEATMGALNRTQRIVLLVLAVLDFVVIGGMATIVVSSMRPPAQTPPITVTSAPPTQVIAATWTPAPTATPRPTLPARLTNTPTATSTPFPTITPSLTPTPEPSPTPVPMMPVSLVGVDFDFVLPNRIPGWQWDAYVNYKGGDQYSPETSYAEPLFTAADDPVRQINGSTLKVETMRYLKFRTWVHQTVTVQAGSRVTFRIRAKAFSSLDSLIVRAGIDATGPENCYNARWGDELRINQDSGVVTLSSPAVVVPPVRTPTPTPPSEDEEVEETQTDEVMFGRVTVCFFAEPAYPHVNNAAFFDVAELIVTPPR
jgi:hypothetical protein